MSSEQTLSIIKPDAVERNLAEDIKNIFIKNNLMIKERCVQTSSDYLCGSLSACAQHKSPSSSLSSLVLVCIAL